MSRRRREPPAPSAAPPPGPLEAPRPERAATRPDRPTEGEVWGWIGLLVLALGLRLFSLGDRPLHHDESIHAHFCYTILSTGDYKYDPVYHGPVQYAMVTSSFVLEKLLHVFDVTKPDLQFQGEFYARLPAALGGVLLVALALLLRPRFGRAAAFAAGALLALSPNMLYVTRFCREDIWSLLGTAGGLLAFDAWLRTKRLKSLVHAALWFAVAFAAKENFYVFLALLVPSTLVYACEPVRGFDRWGRVRQLVDFLKENEFAIYGGLLVFFVVSELLYTVMLIHPESGNPVFAAISYWYGQHKIERVGGPKTYYLPRLALYEFAIFVPAFVWIAARLRRLSAIERFLAGWGVSSLLMYGYLGEKTPWLMVHQILPFVPLAALAWAHLAELAPTPKGLTLRAAAGLMGVASFVTMLSLCFWYPSLTPDVPKAEAAIYVQTSPEILPVVRDMTAAFAAGADPNGAVDGEAGWPFTWYVREQKVMWEMPKDGRKPPVVVVNPEKQDEARQLLDPTYGAQTIPLRSWWIPHVQLNPFGKEPFHPTPKELLVYLFTRKPWDTPGQPNPIGSQNVVVLRRGTAPAPTPAVPAEPTPQ